MCSVPFLIPPFLPRCSLLCVSPGSYHESELQFVFGLPFLGLVNTLRNTEDRTVAATFMQLLGSFAHTGYVRQPVRERKAGGGFVSETGRC